MIASFFRWLVCELWCPRSYRVIYEYVPGSRVNVPAPRPGERPKPPPTGYNRAIDVVCGGCGRSLRNHKLYGSLIRG